MRIATFGRGTCGCSGAFDEQVGREAGRSGRARRLKALSSTGVQDPEISLTGPDSWPPFIPTPVLAGCPTCRFTQRANTVSQSRLLDNDPVKGSVLMNRKDTIGFGRTFADMGNICRYVIHGAGAQPVSGCLELRFEVTRRPADNDRVVRVRMGVNRSPAAGRKSNERRMFSRCHVAVYGRNRTAIG